MSQSTREMLDAFSREGLRLEALAQEEKKRKKEEAQKPKNNHDMLDFLKRMDEEGRKWEAISPEYENQISWGKMTRENKIASCNYNSGHFLLRKQLDGDCQVQPLYCNLCEKCYERHANEHRDKFKSTSETAKKTAPEAKWRKKVVETGTEAESLKKRISRKQDSRHTQLACKDEDKVEIWSLVEDEPGKDMDEIYGEEGNPEKEIDWDEVYKRNRETGQKVSYGGGLRKETVPKKEEEEVSIPYPQVVVAGKDRTTAEGIIYRTNYLKEAETGEEIAEYINLQFLQILENLKGENIEILAVKEGTMNVSVNRALKLWNTNVRSWLLSDNASLPENSGVLTDKETFKYLVYPN